MTYAWRFPRRTVENLRPSPAVCRRSPSHVGAITRPENVSSHAPPLLPELDPAERGFGVQAGASNRDVETVRCCKRSSGEHRALMEDTPASKGLPVILVGEASMLVTSKSGAVSAAPLPTAATPVWEPQPAPP